ncbi:conserved hypothetical protein [Gammaproteobacteria bacterium]
MPGLISHQYHPDDEFNAHKTGNRKGYIIYEPMVVVEVSKKELCDGIKNEKGECKGNIIITCSAGTPFILPDLLKPFLVDARSGFGKAGVEISITNGWQLGSLKDNSDNTAVLGMVKSIADNIKPQSLYAKSAHFKTEKCQAEGLYRVSLTTKGLDLTSLKSYVEEPSISLPNLPNNPRDPIYQ